PDVTEILGKKVYRSVAAIPEPVDLVNIFRRSQDVPPHVDDILAARPRAVWMQSGIRNDEAARRLAEAGIRVVQDRCLMVEHRRFRP
ncbi:MAG TPA: CoA-binding protein, partial [Longimicrobium sp.]|nr:CoA-binding protein [Longimicrobium sp.]